MLTAHIDVVIFMPFFYHLVRAITRRSNSSNLLSLCIEDGEAMAATFGDDHFICAGESDAVWTS